MSPNWPVYTPDTSNRGVGVNRGTANIITVLALGCTPTPKGTLEGGTPMKASFTAIVVAAAGLAATSASLAAGSVTVTDTIVVDSANGHPAHVATPAPGYIGYPGYAAALPGANCYWTRMPMYDDEHNVIGWRGRPVAVCPH